MATNGSDSADGLDWTTAKQTIQAAIDLAVSNDTVLVSDGVYATGGRVVYGAMTTRVVIDKPITVQSVNGPVFTTIRGQGPPGDGAVRCVYVTDGAFLAGFTLTGGATRASGDYAQEQCGGGAWCEPGGVLSNCTLAGNSAYSDGGGSDGGVLNQCLLTGNTAGYYGGGSHGGTLNGCTFTSNSAKNGGASCASTLNDCTLAANSATVMGGGIYWGVVTRCTLTGNWASSAGGGGRWGTLDRCLLLGNSATNGGGAENCDLSHCTLAGNVAYLDGGGARGGTLSNCTVTGNSAQRFGGGAFDGELRNCAVAGNTAASGGGVYGGWMTSCTIARNTAVSNGGGAASATLRNCIVFHNMASNGANWFTSTLYYCCTTPRTAGGSQITNDPLIASAASPHLLAGSPCIDASVNYFADGTDIDGQPRMANGAVDIGCDEFTPPCIGALGVAIVPGRTNVAPGYVVSFEALVTGFPLHLVWTWGDGQASTDCFLTTHAFTGTGTYDVVLTAANDSDSVSCTTRVCVADAVTRYVSPGGGHVAPFTSWAGAATTLQAAVDAAWPGDTVLVSNGVYDSGGRVVHGAMSNRVALIEPITVRSVNGPSVTIIRGQGPNSSNAVRCAYVTNGALLAGFTLTNGRTRVSGDLDRERSGGGVWCAPGGLVSNCIVSGNGAYQFGGGTYGGSILCSKIVSNTAAYGAGAGFSTLNNCALWSNVASYSGGGSYSGTLNNCTLLRNSATYTSGGGAYDGTLNNCILFHNTAPSGSNWINGALQYCCTAPRPAGDGHVTNAPVFVSGLDLRLAVGSPGIDAGSNGYVQGATDLGGSLRVFNGVVDLGAYEFQSSKVIRLTGNLAFGTVFTGKTATASFTIWNDGDTPLAVSGVDYPTGFSGAWSGVIEPGLATSVVVTFAPVLGEPYGGTIAVISDATGGTNTIACSGTGLAHGPLNRFAWTALPSPPTAGIPFGASVIALDYAGNTVTSFAGAVHLSHLRGGISTGLVIGTAASTWFYPMFTAYHDARTQVIYLQSEIGLACTITSLALNVTSRPGQPMTNWTIRMKHTTLPEYPASPVWEGTGWITVFQTNEPRGVTGWRTFVFNAPFAYDGANNLLVDFSFNNASAVPGGSCEFTTSSTLRAVYRGENSGSGDPLDWTGTTPTPFGTNRVPNIRLGVARSGGFSAPIVPASSGAFSAGTWTGVVTVAQAGTNVSLRADDGAGHIGDSMPFEVVDETIRDYWQWAAGITNGLTNYNECATGDGYPNLLKYATGSNPTNADGLAEMNGALSDGTLGLVFRRHAAATDVTMIVEGAYATSNQAAWAGVASNVHGSWGAPTNVVENAATNPASVTVWDAVSEVTNRFLRLRVTRP